MDIIVTSSTNELRIGPHIFPCALGTAGVLPAACKTEGDGATPLGRYPLRQVYYRPDRIKAPATALPLSPLAPDDGWCDAPADQHYNRHVRLPFSASHERLWRDDHIYDIIVVFGHNDDPVIPGLGSAVFLHIARPDFSPTRGCVALAPNDLSKVLDAVAPLSFIDIRADERPD